MHYLLAFPSLFCGLALCAEDIRHRTVSRPWVLAGSGMQLLLLLGLAIGKGDATLVLLPLLYGVLSAFVQLLLGGISRGALGFGDVTCSMMVGQAVGIFGLVVWLEWWVAMGLLGLIWLGLWSGIAKSRQLPTETEQKVPFVPVIVSSAVVAVACTAVLPAVT